MLDICRGFSSCMSTFALSLCIITTTSNNRLLHGSTVNTRSPYKILQPCNPDKMGTSVNIGTATAFGRFVTSALHLTLLFAAARTHGQLVVPTLNCSKACVCASDIISCSNASLNYVPASLPQYTAVLDLSFNSITKLRAEWTPVHLSRLRSLILRNNGLTFLSSEAFVYVTQLRYLDLSSNGLRQLDEFIFEPLEHLEVLLLYNNSISQIDRSAFSGLVSLQRLYLSQNQISRFPLELVKERSRLETLRLLDVSSNRIKVLPLHELQALPAWIKNGIYFHKNPLSCSCELHDLVARWHLKELSSVTDFTSNHTCVIPGQRKEIMPTLDLDKAYLNCSEVKILKEEAYLEQALVLDCDTRQKDMVKKWELPGNIPLSPVNQTAVMLSDGSLHIGPLKAEDSGVYTCYATSDSFNETLYVTVVVFNSTVSGGLENLKTAYTTLVACLVSIVLVLIYLYLTPCRCACCLDQDMAKEEPRESLRSSTASLSQAYEETGQQRVYGGGFPYRHAALLERKDQLEQNGKLNPIGEEDEEWQGDNKERRRSDAESVSSVCSDTPMVV